MTTGNGLGTGPAAAPAPSSTLAPAAEVPATGVPAAEVPDAETSAPQPVPDLLVVSTPSVVHTPSPARAGLVARARAEGVTGPAVVAVSAALVALGAGLDLRRDATLGLGTGLAVMLAALAAPAVVRFRSLATAAVLPPLLVAGAAVVIGRLGGQDRGTRELVLDVGTTLALSAPLVFAATAAAVLVVLVRVGRRVLGR